MTLESPVGNDADHDGRDAELRQLRRRAYGPDADIASDPAALARLRELEGERRTEEAPSAAETPGASATPAIATASPVPPRPPLPATPAIGDASAPTGDSSAPDAQPLASPASPANAAPEAVNRVWPRRLARWSRSPRGIAVAAVVLLMVVALAIVPGLVSDRSDASLRVDPAYADEQLSTEYRLFLRQIGVNMDELERFEDFAGLQVWGTPSAAAVRCVLVSDGPQDVRALSCVPRGLDPVADSIIYPGSPVPGDLEELYPEIGAGAAVRFTLGGDTVEVHVVLADPGLDLS